MMCWRALLIASSAPSRAFLESIADRSRRSTSGSRRSASSMLKNFSAIRFIVPPSSPLSSADKHHRSLGLHEVRIVYVVALFLLQRHTADLVRNPLVVGASAKPRNQVVVVLGEEAGPQ